MLSHPSRKRRRLDGAQSIEGEPGVKNLAGPPATCLSRTYDLILFFSALEAGSNLKSFLEA